MKTRTTRLRALLTLAVGAALMALLTARAADNDGLATDFGGFGEGGLVAGAPLAINDMAPLPDGRIVAVGAEDNTFAVARFLRNGALDASFGAGGLVVASVTETQASAAAHSVVLQPDGKIVVAGEVAGASDSDFAVLRFLPDGALDASFGEGGRVTVDFARGDDRARALAITSAKRFIVGGWAALGGNDDFAIVGLTPSGALDTAFGNGGRLGVDFGNHERVYDLVVQPDDKTLLFGNTSDAAGETSRFALARLNANSTLDTTFDGDGKVVLATLGDGFARSMALQEEGKIVVAGDWVGQGFLIARLNANGAPDPTFDGDGVLGERFGGARPGARAVRLTLSGQILVAGRGDDRLALARYNNDGTRDIYFDGDGKLLVDGVAVEEAGLALLRAPDGRTLVGGGRQLVQLFNDGALDAGGRQLTTPPPAPAAIKDELSYSYGVATLAQPDGRITSVGYTARGRSGYDFFVARHLPSGQPDPGFGTGGTQVFGIEGIHDSAVDALVGPAGEVVVIGSSLEVGKQDLNIAIGRLGADGAVDARCGPRGAAVHNFAQTDIAQSVALQPDGKIVVAGYFTDKMLFQAFVARFDEACKLDPTFGDGGIKQLGYGAYVADVQVLPDRKLLLVGTEKDWLFLARLNENGAPDTSFGTNGKVTTMVGQSVKAIAATTLPGERTLVLMRVFDKGLLYTLLARYDANGQLDQSFGKAGFAVVDLGEFPAASGLAARDDGTVAVVNCSDERSSQPVVLLGPAGEPATRFSGDGKTDLIAGDTGCLTGAVFSGDRLFVGGYAINDRQSTLLLAAYDMGGGACCAPQRVGFAAASASVAEDAGGATLAVRLSQTSAQTVTVRYAATGGSATNGEDYTLAAGALTFAPGQTSQRISVPISNDEVAEADETVVITLGSPGNAQLGDVFSATLVIADDETPAPPTPGPPPTPGSRIFLPLTWR